MTTAVEPYLLMDGAVLKDHPIGVQVSEWPGARPLYADLGEVAAGIGPWLIPSPGTPQDLIEQLIQAGPARFGISILKTRATREMLEAHLHRLRYIRDRRDRKRYFLRYADTRVLSALWPVLNQEQKSGLLGPVTTWSLPFDGDGSRKQDFCRPGTQNASSEHRYPLRLSSAQFTQLMQPTRVRELLNSTLEYAEYLRTMDAEQTFEIAGETLAWLKKKCISDDRIRIATCAAALRSDGRALRDVKFEQAVAAACLSNEAAHVMQWNNSQAHQKKNP